MHLLISTYILLITLAWGQSELAIPALSSPVMDEAQFLAQDQRAALAQEIYEIYTHQGPQITIFTVPDLQGYPIEEFSIRVAEKWQLGTKDKGNGILILIAKSERKMRIEVGDGIEGEITDYDANMYIRKILVPAFKAQDYYQGLSEVLDQIKIKFNIKTQTKGSKVLRKAPKRGLSNNLDNLFPFIILAMIMGQVLFRNRPAFRGLASGVGMSLVGFFMLPGIGIGVLIFFFIIGLILGGIGFSNLLHHGLSHRGGGGGYGGGSWGGSSGGGSWSGGGGGFSGGGSSGDW